MQFCFKRDIHVYRQFGSLQNAGILLCAIAEPSPTWQHSMVNPDMAERLLHLFESLNKLGTTVVVATHDFHLLSRIPSAQMMRLDKGRLLDPTGALRYPPPRTAA